MRTITKLALTTCVVLGGGGFMIWSSIGHAQYYRMVDELVREPLDVWRDKELKVHGLVESGSIVETITNQETQRTFVLGWNGRRIRVFSRGPKPDTFKDRAEVVADGWLVPAHELQARADAICRDHAPGCPIRADTEQIWVLDAIDLMAKCPEHYNGAQTNLKR